MSFIVHANHVRNFERCFTMPDIHDSDSKPTWIDWIRELLETLDDDHYACAFAFQVYDSEALSERRIVVIRKVPTAVSIAEVVAENPDALEGFSGVLTVVKVPNPLYPLWTDTTETLFMIASAGSWSSCRWVSANNDDVIGGSAMLTQLDHRINLYAGKWGEWLVDQHCALRIAHTDGLAL